MNYFKMLFFLFNNMIYTVPTHALLPICNDILRFLATLSSSIFLLSPTFMAIIQKY